MRESQFQKRERAEKIEVDKRKSQGKSLLKWENEYVETFLPRG